MAEGHIVTTNPSGEFESAAPDPEKRRQAESEATVHGRSAARLGSLGKKSKRTPPKAADFGGDMKAFGEALRKYREEENADTDAQARKRALDRVGQ